MLSLVHLLRWEKYAHLSEHRISGPPELRGKLQQFFCWRSFLFLFWIKRAESHPAVCIPVVVYLPHKPRLTTQPTYLLLDLPVFPPSVSYLTTWLAHGLTYWLTDWLTDVIIINTKDIQNWISAVYYSIIILSTGLHKIKKICLKISYLVLKYTSFVY